MEWTVNTSPTYDSRVKRYTKKRQQETLQTHINLQTYVAALNEGVKPMQLMGAYGFVHNEKSGLYAVDQSGAKRKLAETRLYFYPDERTCTVWLLNIGDKASQKRDLSECRDMVNDIIENLGDANGKQKSNA